MSLSELAKGLIHSLRLAREELAVLHDEVASLRSQNKVLLAHASGASITQQALGQSEAEIAAVIEEIRRELMALRGPPRAEMK